MEHVTCKMKASSFLSFSETIQLQRQFLASSNFYTNVFEFYLLILRLHYYVQL